MFAQLAPGEVALGGIDRAVAGDGGYGGTARAYLLHLLIYVKALAKWLLVSSIVGVLCGLLGTAFHVGVELATGYREAHAWVLFTLPAAGLLAVAVYYSVRIYKAK